MARALITAILLTAWAGSLAAQGGGDVKALRPKVEQRFNILPLANGVVLTPRFRTAARSIEIADGTIAVDGTPVTGAELRQKLGADADLILQVSYLDPVSRRGLAGIQATPSPQPPDPTAPTLDPSSAAREVSPVRPERPKRRGAIVRIAGSVRVASDERVTDDVVVVGGSADIDGEVDGDVVVVGGSATLGPQAEITKDVVIVGGVLNQDPKATIGGEVTNVAFGEIPFGGDWARRGAWRGWNPLNGFRPVARFMGTTVRVALLMLFAGLVLFVARTPVEQIAERAAAEPVKSWLVGILAEVLFIPIVAITSFVLAVSIIGIPVLILLIPVAVVASIIFFLVGFTGVAYHIGRLLQARIDQLREHPYGATCAGIVLIVSPLLLARLIGLTGGVGFITGVLVAVGVVVEYLAWTTGLGAATLVRFGQPVRRQTPEIVPPAAPTGA